MKNKMKEKTFFYVKICAILLIFMFIAISIFVINKGKGIVVLMYHEIDDSIGKYVVSKQNFEKQIKFLVNHNYNTIFIEDIENNYKGQKVVALTFDDGYENFYKNVFPILKKYQIKANLYIITSSIDKNNYLNKEEINEIVTSGLVSIGSHTVSHPVLTNLSDENAIQELENSKKYLEEIVGKEIKTISYPTGAYDTRILNLANRLYEFGLTTKARTNFMKNEYKKMEINRYGIGKDTSMFKFKKMVFHSNIFRY